MASGQWSECDAAERLASQTNFCDNGVQIPPVNWHHFQPKKDVAMNLLALLVIGLIYAAFVALVFCLLTMLFGLLFKSFEISGPDNWSFFAFYIRYLIIALVYVFVSMPLNGLIGIGALAIAYKYVFDAGWIQAIVMCTVGGVVALVLFILLIVAVLTPFHLLG